MFKKSSCIPPFAFTLLLLFTAMSITTEAPAAKDEMPGPAALPGAALQAIPEISLSEAVLKTLRANPGISVNQEKVVQTEGLRQKAAGQFDWTAKALMFVNHQKSPLDSYDRMTYFPLDIFQEDTNAYSLGVTKQFRSGVTLTPAFTVTDYDANLDGRVPISRSEMYIQVNVPLLRGLGVKATGADELAASSQAKAARMLARQNIAQIIYTTSTSYWNSLAAKMSFELSTDTNRRSKKLLELVERLVRVGSLEPAALNQAKANLLSGQVDVSAGETNFYRSRQALALAMGMTQKELPNAPDPGSPFPTVMDAATLDKIDILPFMDEALKNRGDYLAAGTDMETAVILLNKAENDTKPKVDLGLKVGYAGEDENPNAGRYFNALGRNVTGMNYFASLSMELPVFNHAARGNLVYRKSQAREFELIRNDLSNRIASDILLARKALSSSITEYQFASESEKFYKRAVEFENQKYTAGTSTLTAVIDIEDRYFRSRIATIDALRKYSIAMAQFRLVTGTLLDVDGNTLTFDARKLMEFPAIRQTSANGDTVNK